MPDPEFLARMDIDEMLVEAGWAVQDMNEINLTLPSVAIREVSIPVVCAFRRLGRSGISIVGSAVSTIHRRTARLPQLRRCGL